MQCDVCQSKEASVFLTQIIDGKMQKINLCETCAKTKGVNDSAAFELADFLIGLGSTPEIDLQSTSLKCPVCGFTQTEFKKTGRLGCSKCYDTFHEMLANALKNMQKGPQHIGKVPALYHKKLFFLQRLKELTTTLQEAVAAEEYEKAALIRDEIHQLESEAPSPS